jgi:hypothetical protein
LLRAQAQIASVLAFHQLVYPKVAARVLGVTPDHFFGFTQLQMGLGLFAVTVVGGMILNDSVVVNK